MYANACSAKEASCLSNTERMSKTDSYPQWWKKDIDAALEEDEDIEDGAKGEPGAEVVFVVNWRS